MTRPAASSSEVIWTANDLTDNPHLRADKADRVQRMFSAIADSYDLNNRLHSMGRDQAWRRRAVKLVSLQPSDDVLDVACGTGDLSLAFVKGGAKSVVGVDFSERMLELARVKGAAASTKPAGNAAPTQGATACPELRGQAVRKSLEFQFADAMNLPFENERFDVVSIAFGIRNVADRDRALSEFSRVLRDGGRVVVLEFSEPRQPLIRWMNNIYTRHVMPFTASMIARDRSGAYKYLPKSVETFPDPEAFMGELRDAGFVNVKCDAMTFGVCSAYVGKKK